MKEKMMMSGFPSFRYRLIEQMGWTTSQGVLAMSDDRDSLQKTIDEGLETKLAGQRWIVDMEKVTDVSDPYSQKLLSDGATEQQVVNSKYQNARILAEGVVVVSSRLPHSQIVKGAKEVVHTAVDDGSGWAVAACDHTKYGGVRPINWKTLELDTEVTCSRCLKH